MAGKKPSKGTPADMRLKGNRASAAVRAKKLTKGAKPKFGSPAWDAKYGVHPFGKGK